MHPQSFCCSAYTQALTWGHSSFSYSQISILLCRRDASFLNKKKFWERDLPVCSPEETVISFGKRGVPTGCTDILWLHFPAWKEHEGTASSPSPVPPPLPAGHRCSGQTLRRCLRGEGTPAPLVAPALAPAQRARLAASWDLTSPQPHFPRHRQPGEQVTMCISPPPPPPPFWHPLNHCLQQQGWARMSCSDPSLGGVLLGGQGLF